MSRPGRGVIEAWHKLQLRLVPNTPSELSDPVYRDDPPPGFTESTTISC